MSGKREAGHSRVRPGPWSLQVRKQDLFINTEEWLNTLTTVYSLPLQVCLLVKVESECFLNHSQLKLMKMLAKTM